MAVAAAFVIGGIAFHDYVQGKSRDADVCGYEEHVYGTSGDKNFTRDAKNSMIPFADERIIGAHTVVIVPATTVVFIEELSNKGMILAHKETMKIKGYSKSDFDYTKAKLGLPKSSPREQDFFDGQTHQLGNHVIRKLTVEKDGMLVIMKGARVLVQSGLPDQTSELGSTKTPKPGMCGRLTDTTNSAFLELYTSKLKATASPTDSPTTPPTLSPTTAPTTAAPTTAAPEPGQTEENGGRTL